MLKNGNMKCKIIVTYVRKNFFFGQEEKSKYKLYHKVRDHCHYTREFRGAAHNICNLRYKVQREIPVVLYNGSNYDYHLIIKELGEKFKEILIV